LTGVGLDLLCKLPFSVASFKPLIKGVDDKKVCFLFYILVYFVFLFYFCSLLVLFIHFCLQINIITQTGRKKGRQKNRKEKR
jgi:hypothetical protein